MSSGAAGGILLATAACVAGTDPRKIADLPNVAGRNEVVVAEEGQNYIYQAAAAAGGRLVQVGRPDATGRRRLRWRDRRPHGRGLAGRVHARPAPRARRRRGDGRDGGGGGQVEGRAVDRRRGAASCRRPATSDGSCRRAPTWSSSAGGKALRGPQCSGGRRGSCRPDRGMPRPTATRTRRSGARCKVGKEEIAGLVRAVEMYVRRDEAAEMSRWQERMERMAAGLADLPGVEAEAAPQREWNRPSIVPGCFVRIDDARARSDRRRGRRAAGRGRSADRGERPIRRGLLINPIELSPTRTRSSARGCARCCRPGRDKPTLLGGPVRLGSAALHLGRPPQAGGARCPRPNGPSRATSGVRVDRRAWDG